MVECSMSIDNDPVRGPVFCRGLGLLLGLLAAGAAAAATPAAAPVPVRVRTVSAAPWRDTLRVLARVESADHTTLAAPYTGRVVGPFLAAGEVPAGAVVARVVVAGLAAQIRAAQAAAGLARTDLHRQQALIDRGLAAQQTLDQAQVRLQQARAALRALRHQADQSVLRAPFAGTLAYTVGAGTVVYRGTPVATLLGRGQLWARAALTPAQARALRVGAPVRWRTRGGLHGTGTVRSLGGSARAAGMVPVYVDLAVPNGLLPGQWLWLELARARAPAWRVPDAALVGEGARTRVFVVRAGRAQAVPVQVLAAHAGWCWVRGALGLRAQVVVAGATRLRGGTPVTVRP